MPLIGENHYVLLCWAEEIQTPSLKLQSPAQSETGLSFRNPKKAWKKVQIIGEARLWDVELCVRYWISVKSFLSEMWGWGWKETIVSIRIPKTECITFLTSVAWCIVPADVCPQCQRQQTAEFGRNRRPECGMCLEKTWEVETYENTHVCVLFILVLLY